jgi:hypothetical protein
MKKLTEEQRLRKNEREKIYRQKNKEKNANRLKEWRKNNPAKVKQQTEKSKERVKQWVESNKEQRKIYYREYRKKRKAADPLYKLKSDIQRLIYLTFKRKDTTKINNTIDILGCSIEQFKLHLESKFESWMSWDNYGDPKDGIVEPNKTWDIDHIIPLKTAKTVEDIIRLNHYTNLQPLCSHQNRVIKRGLINL